MKKSSISIILKHKYIILLAFLCCSGLTFSQTQQQSLLPWGEFLHWTDFKGEPVKSSPYLAITNSGFSSSWSFGARGFQYEVTAYFYPEESWVKPGHRTEKLLRHEQLHFDISELFARKLRQKLNEIEPGKNVESEIRSISKATEVARVHYENLYDQETRHGALKEKQQEWENRIDDEVKILNDFR